MGWDEMDVRRTGMMDAQVMRWLRMVAMSIVRSAKVNVVLMADL